MKTFFSDDDYRFYLELVADHKDEAGVSIWAYCLMPNHVHFVAVPERLDSLSSLFKAVHRNYSRAINFRQKWKGHLWQERFHSFVMDEMYLLATVRYVELNPVKAGLCQAAEQWRWSSAGSHIAGCDDRVVSVAPMLSRVQDWRAYVSTTIDENERTVIRRFTSSGRPAGSESFVAALESLTGRALSKCKPGPKARDE